MSISKENNRVISVGKPGTRLYSLRVVSSIPERSGNEPKFKISVSPIGCNGREKEVRLPFFKKTVMIIDFNFHWMHEDLSMAQLYYCIWRKLKDAGVPTIPNVRIVDDDNVLITDLTADGSQFFGKAGYIKWLFEDRQPGLSGPEKHFVNVDIDKVARRAREIELLALKHGLVLPSDDPFDLLVHPTGAWEVVVLDIGQTAELSRDDKEWIDLGWEPGDVERRWGSDMTVDILRGFQNGLAGEQ